MAVSRFPEATNRQTDFTASGTWTAPSGVYSAEFLIVGAGGGGGGIGGQNVAANGAGGGGGGGAVKKINLSVSPGTSYTITIGAFGAGGSGANGGNGGFSEILNGATSLIKSFGGQGGASITAGAPVTPTVSTTLGAGGGLAGEAVGATQLGGGGGGSLMNGFRNAAPSSSLGIEGGNGNAISTSAINAGALTSAGGYGIDGYGAGGGGGAATATVTFKLGVAGSSFGAAGAQRTSAGTAVGSVPTANTGCGGGGAASFLSATTVAGGNGSDGLVRVVYFA